MFSRNLKHSRKRRWLAFSRQYQSALQKHLQEPLEPRARWARRLGQQAVALGLETLDMARFHKAALTSLRPDASSSARNPMVKRAEFFFTEVMAPIEKTHRAGVRSAARLQQRSKTLAERTRQRTVADRHLKRRMIQRQSAEQALRESQRDHAKLLRESHHVRKHLHQLLRRVLSAQEDEREKISHELRDEVAQTLLGINIRLLTLKKEAATRTRGLAKEIASTQRVVKKSVKTINQLACDLRIQT